jgi:molybdopterin/thiamine biosynthesis adenylyltransferase
VNIYGGLIALHKCNWQIIAWDGSTGHMELLKDPKMVLILRNGNSTLTIIDYLPPDKPNVGLGFLLCPDGSQTPQFNTLKAAITSLCEKIECSFLNASETRQALTQRLVPKLKYVLHTTTLNRLQCNKINSTMLNIPTPLCNTEC